MPGGAAAQGRVDLVRAPQGLLGAEGAQEPGPVGLLGEPVEGVDPVRPVGEISRGRGPEEGLAPLEEAHQAGGLLPVGAVEAAVEADAGAVGVAPEAGHLEAGIGGRSAGADEDVAEALAAPAGDVVADAPARLQGGGHAGRHVEGATPLGGDAVGHAADGALQVGEHVAQAVAVVLRQVEGVALPVQLDAVPVGQGAGLADVGELVLADLGVGEVPGADAAALGHVVDVQEPLGMVLPQPGALVQLPELPRTGVVEVVVVHPHGDVDVHPELVAALDHGLVHALAGLEEAPHVLGVAHGAHRGVDAAGALTFALVHLGRPEGLVAADAPEHGVHLRALERGVDVVHELLRRLRMLPVGEAVAVPVEDDAVTRRRGSRGHGEGRRG